MFAFSPLSGAPATPPEPVREVPVALAAKVRPVSEARQRLLPVSPALAPLFPDGALRRGSTSVVSGAAGGATTLAMALLAGVSSAGRWCAGVGLADPGVAAMAELGVDLAHLVLAPYPGPQWAEVAGDLLGGVDVVLVRPPGRARLTAGRHLMARARERQAALVVLSGRRDDWPVPPDVVLEVETAQWHGLDGGHGHLAGRRSVVWARGRRWADRGCRHLLELPSSSGAVAPVGDSPGAPDASVPPVPVLEKPVPAVERGAR